MPMTPGDGEKESDFMSRCIKEHVDKGHPQDQAVAMCYSMWGKYSQIREDIITGKLPGKRGDKP